MTAKSYKDQLYLLGLFLIWPFGTVLFAVRKFTEQNYHFVIVLFGFLFGFAVYPFGGDVVRYAEQFHTVAGYDWLEFIKKVLEPFLAPEYTTEKPDVYALILQFLVSRFTENQKWFFGFASMIYAFFFVRFLRVCFKEINWTKFLSQILFVAFIIFLIPFHVGATGVRFWTALFIYLVCLLRFIETGENKYILYSGFSMLFHYTFLFPVLLFLFFRFVKLNRFFSLCIVIVSIGVLFLTTNDTMLEMIQSGMGFLEDTGVQESSAIYTDAEYLEERRKVAGQRNWYVNVKEHSIFYFLAILFSLEVFGVFRWNYNEFLKRLFPWLIIFFCLALLTYNLGSIGRFKNIFFLLALLHYAVLIGLHPQNKVLKNSSYVLVPIFLIHIAVSFRVMFYYIDPLLIVGNPLVLYFFESDQSLNEFLIGH